MRRQPVGNDSTPNETGQNWVCAMGEVAHHVAWVARCWLMVDEFDTEHMN